MQNNQKTIYQIIVDAFQEIENPEQRLLKAVFFSALGDFYNPKQNVWGAEWQLDALIWLLTDGVSILGATNGKPLEKNLATIFTLDKKKINQGVSSGRPAWLIGVDKDKRDLILTTFYRAIQSGIGKYVEGLKDGST